MFTGGCASSASGGIKIARWVLIFKIMKNEVLKILHPNAVINVKMDNTIISRDILSQTVMFICFYMIVVALSVIIVSIHEHNVVVGITGSIASIGNVGPAFGNIIGPMGCYDNLHPLSKLVLIIDMYVGRLELIPFLVMLQPEFWSFRR
jgi:trk system potassium uptake protein TrkH